MSRTFCKYGETLYPVDSTICKDGVIQVCMPDGNWDKTATLCDKETSPKMKAINPHTETVTASLHQNLFPDNVINAAQKAQTITACLASVTLAQWAQESGFGKYQLHANNPFGMKWHEGSKYGFVTVHTKEWEKDHYVVIEAKFIAFPSIDVAFVEHGKLLMSPNGPYAKALPFKDDYQKFIETIGPIYATDPNYVKSLLSLINTYSLHSFDSAH